MLCISKMVLKHRQNKKCKSQAIQICVNKPMKCFCALQRLKVITGLLNNLNGVVTAVSGICDDIDDKTEQDLIWKRYVLNL